MRLHEAIAQYLQSLRVEGRAASTVGCYARDLRRLEAVLGADRDVATVTPPDLLAFAACPVVQHKDDGSPRHQTSKNRLRTAVRGLFGFLVCSWVLQADPSLVLRVPSSRPTKVEVLSRRQERSLIATIAEDDGWAARRDLLIVRVLLATGLRVSSLVALQAEDLDVESGVLSAWLKGGRRMRVRLELPLAEALVRHTRGQRGPMFQSAHGGGLSARQVQARLTAWGRRAGIDGLSPHLLRHTFATRLHEQSRDLRRVQQALGHRSVTTTERYVAV